jgi:hypothetical protein
MVCSKTHVSGYHKSQYSLLLILLILILLNPGTANSKESGVSQSAFRFLRLTNDPVSAAMGDCAINLVGEEAALFNPGSLGLYHLDKAFNITLPRNTGYYPLLIGDYHLKSFNVSTGFSTNRAKSDDTKLSRISLGISYSRLKIDFGKTYRYDESGNLYSLEIFDQANVISFGFGVDYYVRVGIGVSYKRVESIPNYHFQAKGNAFDFGMIVELPAINIRRQNKSGTTEIGEINYELRPSLALVFANIGNEIKYPDGSTDDPPKMGKLGFALNQHLGFENSVIVSNKLIYEHNRDLTGRPDPVDKYGFELGLADVFFIRLGRYNQPAINEKVNTRGFGLSSKGIVSWLKTSGKLRIKNQFWDRIITNSDLSYNQAVYDSFGNKDETKFVGLSFSF